VLLVKGGSISKTANGKLQRHAWRDAYFEGRFNVIRASVLECDSPNGNVTRQLVAPRTATEKKLAEIWCAILGIDDVGIYDNFVDLGGQSVLATQCMNRIRSHFNVDLPIESLFSDTANVRDLAEAIDGLSVDIRGKRDNDGERRMRVWRL
jgi:acyl carrier protein